MDEAPSIGDKLDELSSKYLYLDPENPGHDQARKDLEHEARKAVTFSLGQLRTIHKKSGKSGCPCSLHANTSPSVNTGFQETPAESPPRSYPSTPTRSASSSDGDPCSPNAGGQTPEPCSDHRAASQRSNPFTMELSAGVTQGTPYVGDTIQSQDVLPPINTILEGCNAEVSIQPPLPPTSLAQDNSDEAAISQISLLPADTEGIGPFISSALGDFEYDWNEPWVGASPLDPSVAADLGHFGCNWTTESEVDK